MFGNNGNNGQFGLPGQYAGGNPQTGPLPGNHADLRQHGHYQAINAGAPFAVVPVVPPTIQMIQGRRYQPVSRSAILSTVAAMTSPSTQQFRQFNPGTIIAWKGGGYKTDGTALPVGRTALECFKVRFYFTAGTTTVLNVTTNGGNTPILASTLLGTATLPAYLPGSGIWVDQGWQLSVDIQILVDNFEATITLDTLEEYPPGA